MENELTDFLRRLPWASHDLLCNYFGPDKFAELLRENTRNIETIMRADDKKYYSLKPGNYRLLPGISRREMVRKFMAETYGYGIFDTAESPCCNSDFRVFCHEQDIWIRVWGDMGHIAPESLMIFINPPLFGNGVHDIIVTSEGIERTRFLNVQAEINWKDAQENSVEIFQTKIYGLSPLIPETSYKNHMPQYMPDAENYPQNSGLNEYSFNDTKEKLISIQEIRSLDLCRKSRELAQRDYELISFIACNPFLELHDIALIFGGDSADAKKFDPCKEEYERIISFTKRIPELEKLDLVKLIRSGEMKETYIPTWQGMDLLAAYHGTIPLYLKKYSQWPQKSFEKEDFEFFRGCFDDSFHFYDSHTYYEMRWGTIRPEHQKLCNKFGAALICGARSKKSMEGKNIEISGLTTISSNLKISAVSHGRKTIKQFHPDGSFIVDWTDDGIAHRWKVFIEIERNTNSKEKLLAKIEKYRKFIPAFKQFYNEIDDIAVMFFFDDTGDNPGAAIEKGRMLQGVLKSSGIRGFIGFLSDALRTPENWKNKHGIYETYTCGGMMLYQKMWLTTDFWPDRDKHAFPYEKIV